MVNQYYIPVIKVNEKNGIVKIDKHDVELGNVPNLDTSTTANITDTPNKRFTNDEQLTLLASQQTKFDLVNGDIQNQEQQIEYLKKLPYYLENPTFIQVEGTSTQLNQNGATTTASSINIPTGNTGIGSRITVKLTTAFDYTVNDKITFRLDFTESQYNTFQERIKVQLDTFAAGMVQVDQAFNIQIFETSNGAYVTFDYIVRPGVTEFRPYFMVDRGTNSSGSNQTFTLSKIGVYNNLTPLKVLEQQIENIPDYQLDALNVRVRSVNSIAELRSVQAGDNQLYYLTESGRVGMWKVDITDTTSTDNIGDTLVTTGNVRLKRIMSESVRVSWYKQLDGTYNATSLRNAINKGVSLILPVMLPADTINVESTIDINGPLTLLGVGDASSLVLTAFGNLFQLNTVEPFLFEKVKFTTTMPDGTSLINFNLLGGGNVNKRSMIRDCYIQMYNGLLIEKVEDLIITNNRFYSLFGAISIADQNPTLAKNVTIHKNSFYGQTSRVIFSKTAQNILIRENNFDSLTSTPTQLIQVQVTGFESSNLKIEENLFGRFYNNAVSVLATVANAKIKGVIVENNYCTNLVSQDSYSTVIAIAGNIEGINVVKNKLINKFTGIYIGGSSPSQLYITGNYILGDAASDPAAKAIYLENATGMVYEFANLAVSQKSANQYANTTKTPLS